MIRNATNHQYANQGASYFYEKVILNQAFETSIWALEYDV